MWRSVVLSGVVALGGVAALSWESLWQLQASLAFGVSAVGAALTLAATTGGLAAGSLLAGSLLQKRTLEAPLRAYGWLELAIGVAGLLMLPGFALLQSVDSAVYSASPLLARALQLAGVALILAPATMAMGASVPVFQLMARAYDTRVSILYAMNTAGAAIGVLLLGFLVLEQLGVFSTCLAVAAVNLSVFGATRVLAERLAPDVPATNTEIEAPGEPRPDPQAPALSLPMALAAVTVTGLVTFGLEVTWFRALRAAFWSTSNTFSILLAAVLIPLAVGARAVPWLRRSRVSPALLLAGSGVAILLATPLIERIDIVVSIFPGSYYATLLRWFGWTLALVSPSILLLATVLPWTLEDYPDPRTTGWLYGMNSLGAVLGSVLGAWVLLPNLGVARASWLLGGLVLLLSLLASRPRRRWIPVVAGAIALFIAASNTSSPGRDRIFGEEEGGPHRILAHKEGPDFTTSVITRDGRVRVLMIDGFAATSEARKSAQYMHWMGSLPALLHPEPKRALVICFGTGQTANGLRIETLGDVDMVDISGAVFELAHHFRSNQGVLEDPRTHAIEMDGRAWLRRSEERYDIVTLEPMPPNFSGVNSLYSLEFYELLADRLNEGGIATQWLPIHLLSPEHSASIVATFLEVFPDALLWWNPVGGTGILLGRKEGAATSLGSEWPGLELRPAERRLSDEEIRKGTWLDRAQLEEYAAQGSIITDDNQMLQFGKMRPGLGGLRAKQLGLMNRAIIEGIAGRAPYIRRGSRPDRSASRSPGR